MEIGDVLLALNSDRGLPVEALRAAAHDKATAVPAFTAEIDRCLTGTVDNIDAAIFFIFHLLGDWRETTAYRPLARMLQSSPKKIDHILGDAVTATSHRVMAAVFDGDPQPLYDIVLDRHADEYIRSRMCEALAMLALRGAITREEVTQFLRACWDHLQPAEDCFVWNGWQSAIAMLGLADLKPLVRMAFERESINGRWLGYDDFERDLDHAVEHGGALPHTAEDEYALFGDTIQELSTWHGFSPAYERDRRRQEREAARPHLSNSTVVNLVPKVGRNEPCPCGSGKKFKKCCGLPHALTA